MPTSNHPAHARCTVTVGRTEFSRSKCCSRSAKFCIWAIAQTPVLALLHTSSRLNSLHVHRFPIAKPPLKTHWNRKEEGGGKGGRKDPIKVSRHGVWARAPFNNSAPLGGGGPTPPTHSPQDPPPPLKRLGLIFLFRAFGAVGHCSHLLCLPPHCALCLIPFFFSPNGTQIAFFA